MPGVADHNVYRNVNCNVWKEKICLESILVRMYTFIVFRAPDSVHGYIRIDPIIKAPTKSFSSTLWHCDYVPKSPSNSGRIVLATSGPNHPLEMAAKARKKSHRFVDRSAAAAAGTS